MSTATKPDLDHRGKSLLRFLVARLEEVEAERVDNDFPPTHITESRLYGEALGLREAIAYATGLYGIRTPKGGGVPAWLGTIKEAIK